MVKSESYNEYGFTGPYSFKKLNEISDARGLYLIVDGDDESNVLYVGYASSLSNRLKLQINSLLFSNYQNLKIYILVDNEKSRDELNAMELEFSLLFKPKLNKSLRLLSAVHTKKLNFVKFRSYIFSLTTIFASVVTLFVVFSVNKDTISQNVSNTNLFERSSSNLSNYNNMFMRTGDFSFDTNEKFLDEKYLDIVAVKQRQKTIEEKVHKIESLISSPELDSAKFALQLNDIKHSFAILELHIKNQNSNVLRLESYFYALIIAFIGLIITVIIAMVPFLNNKARKIENEIADFDL